MTRFSAMTAMAAALLAATPALGQDATERLPVVRF